MTTESGYISHLQDMSHVAQELCDAPIGPSGLAANERDGFMAIERVVHRHQFTDHDCQTTTCLAMFIWNSFEMTNLLADAYERGRRDGTREG